MELPHLGKNCSKAACNKLDFLPIKCDACNAIFCEEHYRFKDHDCEHAYKKDNQVPVCPLCNIPITVKFGELPDIVVGAHIDKDCQSDPAKNRRRVFTNKCSFKGCKVKEVIPVICSECKSNFCLKHRFPSDHKCEGKEAAIRKLQNGRVHQTNRNIPDVTKYTAELQGNISEDEALAKALALSMQDRPDGKKLTQEELDFALAKQLQLSGERQTVGNSSNSRGRCDIS